MSCLRLKFLALVLLLAYAVLGGAVSAAEPYEEFVRALREKGYYDMAVFYLDQLATKPGVPQEMRELIPYEKALTLLESSRVTRSPERQVEQLDQALAFLSQFVKESPNHPRAGDANSERAQILIGKARVEILQSRAPANQGAKGDFQKRARDLVAQARQVFDAAYKQHEAAWKKYPTYINRETNEADFEARAKSEVNMIRAQLDLALCTYEEAQTYEVGSADYKRLLGTAATQFEEMHQRYRSQVGGLYARLWQGKCFEETGDLQKALGIYNELLAHPGTEGAITRLKDQTLQFKLISLNSDARKDYQLVVDLGEEWLKLNKAEARTRTGLGIRWEVARAYEMLGDRREIPKNDAERFWRASKENASQVNRFPGEFKDVSLALMQRLDVKIGGKEKKPATFDAAFGLGRQLVTEIQKTKEQLDGARKAKQPAEEIKKLEQDYNNQLTEALELFDLALRLATPQDDDKSITTARYMYAYVNFLKRRNYEAAILGEFVARTADKEEVTTGLDAAYLSMAAYVQAYNDAKGTTTDKDADLRFIIKACNLLSDRWPDSDRANDARMTLGRIYSQIKDPVKAAEWYNKVPETDAKYSEAQLAAGQAYWTAYLTVGRGGEETKPSAEQLTDWRQKAEQLLRAGIAKLSATAPKEGAAPPELIAAKMSLAQILISLGKDGDAIKLLIDDPQSVIKAITVADETKRPAQGVQSRQFATETYKLLLRAYVGNGKLNEARETMKTLEKVAGADSGADVTELYVGLGKLLREELDRFREAGETARFDSLMTSFQTFLNDLYSRKEGQTFGSLSWIGETYFALGEAAGNDASRATASFEKAGKAFEDIVAMADAKPDFVPADQLPAVKVRLARCYRLKKDFETADKLITEIVKSRDKDLRAQIEAALIYQDWGASGDTEKLQVAINGSSEKHMWGWRNLGTRVLAMVERGRQDFMPTLMEARLNGSKCRQLYALGQSNAQKRTEELEKAEMELVATVTVIKDIPEDQFAQLNELYRQILKDGGKIPVDLQASGDETVLASSEPETPPPATTKKAKPKPTSAAASPPVDNTMTYVGITILLLAVVGAAGWFLIPRKKTKAVARRDSAGAFAGVAVGPVGDAGTSIPTSVPTKPKVRPATPGTTVTGAAQASKPVAPGASSRAPGAAAKAAGPKPSAAPASGSPASPPKPRPKPQPPTT